jgi:hypothetical protein
MIAAYNLKVFEFKTELFEEPQIHESIVGFGFQIRIFELNEIAFLNPMYKNLESLLKQFEVICAQLVECNSEAITDRILF